MGYVIGVKEVRDYYGNPIPENKQKYLYVRKGAGTNNCSNYYSFSDDYHAIKFSTKQGARNWWKENKRTIVGAYKYDWSTLTIFGVLYLKTEKLN